MGKNVAKIRKTFLSYPTVLPVNANILHITSKGDKIYLHHTDEMLGETEIRHFVVVKEDENVVDPTNYVFVGIVQVRKWFKKINCYVFEKVQLRKYQPRTSQKERMQAEE